MFLKLVCLQATVVHLTFAVGYPPKLSKLFPCTFREDSCWNKVPKSISKLISLIHEPNFLFDSVLWLQCVYIINSNEPEDLSAKVKSSFSKFLCGLSSPTSLKEMATSWDLCVRKVVLEYAQLSGGGTFSSKYGTWKEISKT